MATWISSGGDVMSYEVTCILAIVIFTSIHYHCITTTKDVYMLVNYTAMGRICGLDCGLVAVVISCHIRRVAYYKKAIDFVFHY